MDDIVLTHATLDVGKISRSVSTHPHKKGPVMENYTRHPTSFSMVIYQADPNMTCGVPEM